jgi:hypothetical protein
MKEILPLTVASKLSIQIERTLRTVSFARATAVWAASSQLLSDSHKTSITFSIDIGFSSGDTQGVGSAFT